MLWFSSHRRYGRLLSAYLDGELSPADAASVQSHSESCDSCAEALADLRLVSAMIAELPDVETPRSFALSSADVSPVAAPPYAVRSLNSGLRLTGGALAAALAVLLVLDAGGVVGGGGRENRVGLTETQGEVGYDAGVSGADSLYAQEGEESSQIVPGQADGVGGPAAAPEASPETQAPADDDKAPRSSATAPPAAPGTLSDAADELGLNGSGGEDTKTFTDADLNVDSGDGLSPLTVTEIVLAALLGASIIGVVAATYAGRRPGQTGRRR